MNTPYRRRLLDTQLLVEIRAGHPHAIQFAHDLLRLASLDMSVLSALVVLSECQSAADVQRDLKFFGHNRVHRITAAASRRAVRIMRQLTPPAGITADDAIVAATALTHKLP